MNGLTDIQARVLSYIKQFRKANGWPPTGAEINERFGWSSPNAARQHLNVLEKKGRIRITRKTARGIEVL